MAILTLRALQTRPSLTLSELAEETGFGPSSLSRFYKVLTHVGVIEHAKNKKGFAVGPKAVEYMTAWGLSVLPDEVNKAD